MLTINLVFSYFLITLGASFQFGFQTGVLNAVFDIMQEFVNETAQSRGKNHTDGYFLAMSSLMVTGFPIGGIFGSLMGAYIANKFGRKKALFIFSVPTLIGSTLMMISKAILSYESVIIGRMIIGFSCGAYTGIAPMMLSEFSPVSIKGASGVLNQLVIVFALLLAQILGIPQALGNTEYWPYLLGFSLFPCLFQLLILPFCPESPRYLMINQRNPVAAKQALRWLRGIDYADIELEINEMETEVTSLTSNQSNKGFVELVRLQYLRIALFVAILCHFSQQFSGINAILNYSTTLFKSAGVSASNAVYATLGTGIVNLVVTLASIFLVERFGRRTLHLSGLGGMFVTSILFMVCLIVRHYHEASIYIGIVCIYLFVAFFAIGPGSIPWFIVAELFTQENRDVALAISVMINWISQIVVVMVYPQLLRSLGDYSFTPFIVLLGLFFGLLFKFMPETKGQSPAALEALFRSYTGETYSPCPNEPTDSEKVSNSSS